MKTKKMVPELNEQASASALDVRLAEISKNFEEEVDRILYGRNSRRSGGPIVMLAFSNPELEGANDSNSGGNKEDIRHITLTLNWSYLTPEEKLVDAEFKMGKWLASTFCPQPFPSNIPTIDTVKGYAVNLHNALTVVGKNRPSKPQKQAIDKAAKILMTAVKSVMTVFQNAADSDVENAKDIAFDGGFDYSDGGIRGPRANGLHRTTEKGVLLV